MTAPPKPRSLPNRLKGALGPALNLTLRPLSGWFPRSDRRWAFGHIGDTFSGNPKYLFLWLALNRPDVHATWITGRDDTFRTLRDAGHRVAKRWSPAGVAAALRAGVFVTAHGVQHVNMQLSVGALHVNLWHGVGLKAIQFGDPDGTVARAHREADGRPFRRAALLDYLVEPDLLATTSDAMRRHFASQFRLPPERLPLLGYPRNDVSVDPHLRDAASAIDRRAGFAPAEGFAETYIYMPTFRDSGRPFLADALPDLARLEAVLERRGALLYLKPHPRTAAGFAETRRIRLWPDAVDVYPYLADFDALITDYSSVLYDRLLVRPAGVVVYAYDLDDYLRDDRALLHPFDENVAGIRADSFDALCGLIGSGAALGPAPGADAIVERFWGGSPTPSSPVVVAHVEASLARRRRRGT